jgi:hypothetical protein
VEKTQSRYYIGVIYRRALKYIRVYEKKQLLMTGWNWAIDGSTRKTTVEGGIAEFTLCLESGSRSRAEETTVEIPSVVHGAAVYCSGRPFHGALESAFDKYDIYQYISSSGSLTGLTLGSLRKVLVDFIRSTAPLQTSVVREGGAAHDVACDMCADFERRQLPFTNVMYRLKCFLSVSSDTQPFWGYLQLLPPDDYKYIL